MEIPLISEDAGTIVELLVGEGDAVQEGQVIAVIEV
jgi:acetyl-CoA carboxylase biotin carboxyl carrier protein